LHEHVEAMVIENVQQEVQELDLLV